jgi:hypothetical protein
VVALTGLPAAFWAFVALATAAAVVLPVLFLRAREAPAG